MIDVSIALDQPPFAIPEDRLRHAVQRVLAEAGVVEATVSLAIVGDEAIARLNERFLAHHGPTDVLSFLLEREGDRLEGEIVASADTAACVAARLGWPAADELLLYVVHGALHLAGYDDRDDDGQQQMRAAERRHLAYFGLSPPEQA